uniref:NEAT domain-containing protein n=1 Tax=Globodera pallida TaxID=36090 RepID=A0A183BLD8_GLOPA
MFQLFYKKMSKIGLCAKVCWFIYVQIVLLLLTHYHQSANAIDILEVYFDPPGVQYTVTVSTTQIIDGTTVTKEIIKDKQTMTMNDRQMIELDKTKLANKDGVLFDFTHPNKNVVVTVFVLAELARKKKELSLVYDELKPQQQILDD